MNNAYTQLGLIPDPSPPPGPCALSLPCSEVVTHALCGMADSGGGGADCALTANELMTYLGGERVLYHFAFWFTKEPVFRNAGTLIAVTLALNQLCISSVTMAWQAPCPTLTGPAPLTLTACGP